jgi:hypothetical protein
MLYLANVDPFGEIVTSDYSSKVRVLIDTSYNTDFNSRVYPPAVEGES